MEPSSAVASDYQVKKTPNRSRESGGIRQIQRAEESESRLTGNSREACVVREREREIRFIIRNDLAL